MTESESNLFAINDDLDPSIIFLTIFEVNLFDDEPLDTGARELFFFFSLSYQKKGSLVSSADAKAQVALWSSRHIQFFQFQERIFSPTVLIP